MVKKCHQKNAISDTDQTNLLMLKAAALLDHTVQRYRKEMIINHIILVTQILSLVRVKGPVSYRPGAFHHHHQLWLAQGQWWLSGDKALGYSSEDQALNPLFLRTAAICKTKDCAVMYMRQNIALGIY